MKALAGWWGVYLLLLMLLPCGERAAHAATAHPGATPSTSVAAYRPHAPAADHDPATGHPLCSPLCRCACCGQVVFMPTPPPAPPAPGGVAPAPAFSTPAPAFASRCPALCWHPPR